MWLLRPRHEKRAQPERARVQIPQRGQCAQRCALSRLSQDVQQPIQSANAHAHPGTIAFHRHFYIIKAKNPSLVSFIDAKVSLLSSVGKFLRFSTRTNCFFWERRNVVDVPGWPSLKHHLPLHQDQPQSLPNPCWLSRPHRPRGPCSPPTQRPLRPKTPSLISVHPKQTELGLAWSKLAYLVNKVN